MSGLPEKLVDSQSEPLSPDEARTCNACKITDHVDAGAECDKCGAWHHEDCGGPASCSAHRLCETCFDKQDLCPVCKEVDEDREMVRGIR